MYYWTCPDCGENLDPGERHQCEAKQKETAPLQPGTASHDAGKPTLTHIECTTVFRRFQGGIRI